MVAGYGVMHDITSVKAKREAVEDMNRKEMQMACRIDALVRSGELSVDVENDNDGDGSLRGCGGRFFCGLLGKKRRGAAVAAAAAAASAAGAAGAASGAAAARTGASMAGEQRARVGGAEARIFGQRGGKTATAADRLNHAAESVEAHAEQLAERARVARAKAAELVAAHKKPEAMAALRRAKGLEKQLETASATHAALERQVDVLAESALQKEVASALSASVASTKKKTKGLLSKAEEAVDGATELKDFAEDIAQTLGTLQTDTFDDDELLAEIEAMQQQQQQQQPQAQRHQIGGSDDDERTPVMAAAAAPMVVTATSVVDASNYPKVPSRAVERRKLLADDGARSAHEGCGGR